MREIFEKLKARPLLLSIAQFVFGALTATFAFWAWLGSAVDLRLEASSKWKELKAEVNQLSAPSGAVFFFDRAEGCPDGWTDLAADEPNEFAGRAIVAIGKHPDRAVRTYRQTGGNEVHRLAINEVPLHSHGVVSSRDSLWLKPSALHSGPGVSQAEQVEFIRNFDAKRDLLNCRDCPPDTKLTALKTKPAGGQSSKDKARGKPHSNMPPYVALYVCRKK